MFFVFKHKKMLLNILILLLLNVHDVVLIHFSQKPVPKTLWQESCSKNDLALNDCNWCRCGANRQFTCRARICSQVDMFGHFNDAIQNMDVGMEGHGYWRSLETACEAGVQYQKDDLLCVCDEDGKWPNSVCRDVLQILHSVVPTKYTEADNQTCSPNKLYQIKCNVCYCPSAGTINEEMCTKKNCSDDTSETISKTTESKKHNQPNEIYAECERGKSYQIGCKTCICLPNNRLLCDNCTEIKNITDRVLKGQNSNRNLCTDKTPGKHFKKDCNICYCDKKDVLYCTVLKCLEDTTKVSQSLIDFETVDPPVDDNDCVPGTEYKRGCNSCHCFKYDGVKYFGCTTKKCENGTSILSDSGGCVEGTTYEKNCLICHCVKEKGESKELCTFNEECKKENEVRPRAKESLLEDLHGYCEPLHIYNQDCNKCKCLTDGKTVACTSKICKLKPPKPMIVEFIPFIQKQNVCPKGHRYKVDCNYCQCLSNGNAICTTQSCKPALKSN